MKLPRQALSDSQKLRDMSSEPDEYPVQAVKLRLHL